MRNYHIVLSGRIGVADARRAIAARARPRHFMLHVADLLGAEIYEPAPGARPARATLADRILAPAPAAAALAEKVVAAAEDDDVIFCNSEAISLPAADRLLAAGKKTRLASLVHNMLRPRIAALMATTAIVRRHAALYSVSPLHAEGLARALGASGPAAELLAEQIDDEFFTPGPAGPKTRPVVASVGLERRDYLTLAEATADLPVEVRVSAFSQDAGALSRAFPARPPANMERRFYEWRDLVQLYRDADLVVVPLKENRYAAGMTSLLEGMAAGRPVIATATAGLRRAFADGAAILWIPPRDAPRMKREIERLLADAPARAALAARGARLLAERHTENQKAEEMAARLRAL